MKLRPIVLAIAVLAILSALAYVLQRPPRPAAQDPRVGQPVFSAAALTQTVRQQQPGHQHRDGHSTPRARRDDRALGRGQADAANGDNGGKATLLGGIITEAKKN